MANTDSNFMFSPADDLASVPNPGGGSVPSAPSVFPDVDMSGASGDSAPGSKAAESYAGLSETVSAGGASGVQLADVPNDPSADLGGMLVGGLGDAPKPSGSY